MGYLPVFAQSHNLHTLVYIRDFTARIRNEARAFPAPNIQQEDDARRKHGRLSSVSAARRKRIPDGETHQI